MFFSLSKLIILIIALSVDAFAAGFAYGVDNVKIPVLSAAIIASLSDLILIASLFIGNLCKTYIPDSITTFLSFAILFALGILKLFDSSIKKKAQEVNKTDIEVLSPAEALALGLALSLDSAAAGIGAASSDFPLVLTVITAFIIGILTIYSGCHLGRTLASKTDFNFSIIGGVLLIILAFTKFC